MKVVVNEEGKLTARPQYRTLPATLRQIAAGHLLFEMQPSPGKPWDRFQIRNLGLSVNRRMAMRFGGDAAKIRKSSAASVARALGLDTAYWKEPERLAFENLALVLALIPGLSRWTDDEKRDVARIARAKGAADESLYVRLLQKHRRLRDAIIKLAS
jgi:hypothetical protein